MSPFLVAEHITYRFAFFVQEWKKAVTTVNSFVFLVFLNVFRDFFRIVSNEEIIDINPLGVYSGFTPAFFQIRFQDVFILCDFQSKTGSPWIRHDCTDSFSGTWYQLSTPININSPLCLICTVHYAAVHFHIILCKPDSTGFRRENSNSNACSKQGFQ